VILSRHAMLRGVKRLTLADVAREAGVSVKTASRVVNQERWVSAETRLRVDQAIERLGFRPSLNARALAGRRSFFVAFVFDVITPLELGVALSGAIQRCRLADYRVLVDQVTASSPDVGRRIEDLVVSARVDGVILAPAVCDSEQVLEVLERLSVPYVRMAPSHDRSRGPYVAINDFRAAFDMTSHLIDLGHREIAFVRGDMTQGASRERYEGFIASMRHRGYPVAPEDVCEGDFTFSSGVAAFERLSRRGALPTAIFASNDMMALGICTTAQSRGIRIPSELSVAGFDDISQAATAQPPLTTVRYPLPEITTTAADFLIELASGSVSGGQPKCKIWDCEIVIRGSTVSPPDTSLSP
jgi:LacI family transcriptional regulator